MNTYKACWMRSHLPTLDAATAALDELGILADYDVLPCRHCGEWIWNRRPDWGDAA